jgi:hypothetical protein
MESGCPQEALGQLELNLEEGTGVVVEGSSTSLGLCGVTNLDSSIMGPTTSYER